MAQSLSLKRSEDREDWPFAGEYLAASERRFEAVILMVPFFKARKVHLKRHMLFLNELGFDALVFDLYPPPKKWTDPLLASNGKIGLKALWADQIEKLLNEIPGKKIVYSFSNPSAAAIQAIARRKSWDVLGLVCDGGPSIDLYQSMINYYTTEEPISFGPEKTLKALLTCGIWSPRFLWDLQEDVKALKKDFPVLSIRGWKDPLIPVHHIDPVFELNPTLHLEKLSLPEAGHLNGLRDFPQLYKPAVEKFLLSLGSLGP